MASTVDQRAVEVLASGRNRLQLELAPDVAVVLDRASEVLGVPRAQIAVQALLKVLPDLLAQAEAFRRSAQGINHGKGGKRG
jgi:uncharacterized protein (DUF1778 family)